MIRSTPGHVPLEQGSALVLACLGVLGEADGPVLVELEEAELGVDFVDRSLPVRRHLLVHLGRPLEHAPPDGAQAAAVGFLGLFVGAAFERGAHRGGEHRARAGPTQKGARLAVTGAPPGVGHVEKPDRREEGHDLERRLVVEHLEEGPRRPGAAREPS